MLFAYSDSRFRVLEIVYGRNIVAVKFTPSESDFGQSTQESESNMAANWNV